MNMAPGKDIPRMNFAAALRGSAVQAKPLRTKYSPRLTALAILLLACAAHAAAEGENSPPAANASTPQESPPETTSPETTSPETTSPETTPPDTAVHRPDPDVFDNSLLKSVFKKFFGVFEPSSPTEPLCPSRLDHLRRLGEEDKQSETILENALASREKVLGKKAPLVAESLINLAFLHEARGDYEGAKAFYARALEIRTEAHGNKSHQEIANLLSNIASLHYAQEQYKEAEEKYKQALSMQQELLGENHLDVAGTYSNLALLYKDQGRYAEAKDAYERAIKILRALMGDLHPRVASLNHSLADIYRLQGLYTESEPLHKQALAVREASFGENHPDVASSLHYLADLYTDQGLYTQAERLYERALSIREVNLGECHPDVASSLQSLAGLYKSQGMYTQAQKLYERAIAIQEAALGENHPRVADLIHELASVHHAQRHLDQAARLYERARQRRLARGEMTPQYADSLFALASLAAERGNYTSALHLFDKALTIREFVFGDKHPKVIEAYHHLARLFLARQDLASALPLLEKAVMRSEEFLRREGLGRTEYQLTRLMDMSREDEELLYSLASAHPDDAGVRELALTVALFRKSRALDELANTSRIIYNQLSPADATTFEVLRNLRTEYAKLAISGPGTLPQAAYQQLLNDLETQGDTLEANLAKNVVPLRALQDMPEPEALLGQVTKALDNNKDGASALIEFVAYNGHSPIDDSGNPSPGDPKRQPRYLALLLFHNGETRAIDLGPAGPIDLDARAMRDALANGSLDYMSKAQTLYKRIFQPIAGALGSTQRLFIAPDSEIALIPFDALHDGNRFLVDAMNITYLNSGKELLPRTYEVVPSTIVAVMADPDFGESPLKGNDRRQRSPPNPTTRAELDKLLWTSLPATRKEADFIKSLYPQAFVYLKAAANKETLMSMKAPGVFHIATHAYFFEAPSSFSANLADRGLQILEDPNSPLQSLPTNPLLLSGLVLSRPKDSDKTTGGALVTALELASLNLWGTQLVVLSACNTGQGTSKPGQGVMGLRRSLSAAGAETLVTSLWKVDDETTRELMENYYQKLFDGRGRAAALRDAMRTLRMKYPHPHFWAPFIAIGKDEPLQGLTQQFMIQSVH